MRLRLRHETGDGGPRPILVEADARLTIGQLAEHLPSAVVGPRTLTVNGKLLPADQEVGDDLLANGSRVRVVPTSNQPFAHQGRTVAQLIVGGETINVRVGTPTIGAYPATIVIPGVPAGVQASITGDRFVEIRAVETGDRVEVDAELVTRARVTGRATLRLGDVLVVVVDARAEGEFATGPRVLLRPPRRRSAPPLPETAEAFAADLDDLVWHRRPGRPGYGSITIGRTGDAPLALDLVADRTLGLVGPVSATAEALNWWLLQLTALHSPEDLGVSAILGAGWRPALDWLKWCPQGWYADTAAWPDRIATTRQRAETLLSQLEQWVEAGDTLATQVLVVDADAPLDRARVLRLMDSSRAAGVIVIWLTSDWESLPGSVKRVIDSLAPDRWEVTDYLGSATAFTPMTCNGRLAAEVAIRLAGLRDASSIANFTPLPSEFTLDEAINDIEHFIGYPEALILGWQAEDNPLSGRTTSQRRSLRVAIGTTGGGPVSVSIDDGLLIGGVGGTGKSELLAAALLNLAIEYGPSDWGFLVVDFRSTSPLSTLELHHLPHCIGTLGPLDEYRSRRILRRFEAEIERREQLLARFGINDLADLPAAERASRIFVVADDMQQLDEVARDFIRELVALSVRHPAAGIRFVLATQDSSRVPPKLYRLIANRVAFRTFDAEDSVALVGASTAQDIDPASAGRALLRSSSSLLQIQATSLGGTNKLSRGMVGIGELIAGMESPRRSSADRGQAATFRPVLTLKPLLSALAYAAEASPTTGALQLETEALPTSVDLLGLIDWLPGSSLPLGIEDRLEDGAQSVFRYDPAEHGSLLVTGPARAGKSTTLRSIAIASGILAAQRASVTAIGEDLSALAQLTHVSSWHPGSDEGTLEAVIESLAADVLAREGKPITDVWRLVLWDNLDTSSARYGNVRDALRTIISRGRNVGIVVVASVNYYSPGDNLTDQFPTQVALGPELQTFLPKLRRGAVLSPDFTPGRGLFVTGGATLSSYNEVQVGVPDGNPSEEHFLEVVAELAAAQRDAARDSGGVQGVQGAIRVVDITPDPGP